MEKSYPFLFNSDKNSILRKFIQKFDFFNDFQTYLENYSKLTKLQAVILDIKR